MISREQVEHTKIIREQLGSGLGMLMNMGGQLQ